MRQKAYATSTFGVNKVNRNIHKRSTDSNKIKSLIPRIELSKAYTYGESGA